MVLRAERRDQGHQGRGALLKYRGEWSVLYITLKMLPCIFDFCSFCHNPNRQKQTCKHYLSGGSTKDNYKVCYYHSHLKFQK